MMIPGEWETRHRPDRAVVVEPAPIVRRNLDAVRSRERRELTDWWEMSIFWEMSIVTVTLFAAMLLAMWLTTSN